MMSSWAAPEGAKGCWQWAALNTARNARVCLCVFVCLLPFCSRQKKRKGNKFLFFGVYLCGGRGSFGCVEGIIPFLYLTLPFFHLLPFEFFLFLLCRGPFSVWHKPFPYCFNKHLKCLAPNLCTLYTQTVSHNQHQPAHLWQPVEGGK